MHYKAHNRVGTHWSSSRVSFINSAESSNAYYELGNKFEWDISPNQIVTTSFGKKVVLREGNL